ncbi:MAG: hypothetical protein PW734_11165 [Verrucomicrobium sp.]|nr:hypothetical protein [Verrucomicrobium sp.]
MKSRFEKSWRRGWLLAVALAALAVPLRAAPLSVKLIESNAGKVASATVKRYGEQVYVTGLVYWDGNPATGAHVHVEWHDRRGSILAAKTEGVNVTGRPFQMNTIPFTVGFPASRLLGAKAVQVSYSSSPHVFCSK